jgi:hypothetical protein
MHPIIQKTFGGLTKQYYFRQFFFGALFATFFFFMMSKSTHGIAFGALFVVVVNTLLYPYARFVYESIVGFIMGDNVFFVNAIMMLFVKIFTMAMCWAAAIFIAPIGLAYLYYHHTKNENA